MRVIQLLVPWGISLVAALVVGCADQPPHTAQTATTGAPMSRDDARAQIAQLERERDEARAALAQERATQEGDRLRSSDDAASKSARDDLEARTLTALDQADRNMEALRAKSVHASGKERQAIEKAITDGHAARRKIYAELRTLHAGDIGPSWDTFRAQVDQDVASLQDTLAIEPDLKPKPAQPTP